MGLPSLWFGVLAGPLAWSTHLLVSYALVPWVCATGLEVILHVVTLATAGITLAAGLVAWRSWRRARITEPADSSGVAHQTARFMALSGILLSVLFLVVIIAQGVPIWFQDACDPAGGLGI